MKDSIRIAIVDDHEIARHGVRSMVAENAGLEIVAEGACGQDALRIAREVEPDVMILDVELPDISGVEVTETLREEHSIVRILAMSAFDYRRYVYGLLGSGASGYMMKEELTPDTLLHAIESILREDETWISPELATRLIRLHSKTVEAERILRSMSPREKEILFLLARGANIDEIGGKLFIAPPTVRNHVANLRSKVDVRTRAELMAWAWENKVVVPG